MSEIGFVKDDYILDLKNNNISNEFICPICHSLFVNATELKHCGHTYCKDCIHSWYRSGNSPSCPICKKGFYTFDMTSSKFIDRYVGKISVNCPHCEWSGLYIDYLKHVDEDDVINRCSNLIVSCILCDISIKSELMKKHKEIDCVYREVRCDQCQQKVRLAEMTKHLEDECEETIEKCQNKECDFEDKRKNHEEHLLTCNYQEIKCIFNHLGCDEKFIRNIEDRHMMLYRQKHLDKALTMINVILKDNKALKESNELLTSNINTWKNLCNQQNRMIDSLELTLQDRSIITNDDIEEDEIDDTIRM